MNHSNLESKSAANAFSEMENTIELTFTESKSNKKPIARYTNGKICILDHNCKLSHRVLAGETWLCEIIKNEDKKIVVKPTERMITIEQNKMIFENKLSKLIEKFGN